MLCAAVVLLVPAVASAETLRLTYVDPVGDNEGQAPDVVKLVVIFDNVTGDFEITVTSTETNPFAPTDPYKLAIYVNLFNLEAGSTTQDPSFFSSISDFQLSATAASLNIVGVNSRLTAWELGDEVAISGAQGNPIGIGQFGSVARVSGSRGPFLGDDFIATGDTAIASLVPEPSAVGLAICGTAVPFLSRRLRRCERGAQLFDERSSRRYSQRTDGHGL